MHGGVRGQYRGEVRHFRAARQRLEKGLQSPQAYEHEAQPLEMHVWG